jgi:D-serine deaminase-like pyridoxal phosphate-dependent protein
MIKIAGNASRLRPHIKTHKMSEIIRMQLNYGITRFKCATIAEAELLAMCGAPDIMLAMQPVGPNLLRYFTLVEKYGESAISCIADSEDVIISISDFARTKGIRTTVWLDINNGMNRTGVVPGEKAVRLVNRIADSPMLTFGGLHVYDGHIHDSDFATRKSLCDKAYEQVEEFISEITGYGYSAPAVVAGGTPSFPVHAMRENVELSPGTLLLWDFKSDSSFEDMDFLQAAIIVTRVVSKPSREMLCLDLGHKALASEMQHPRVYLYGITNYTAVNHSEEHLVIRTRDAENFKTGDIIYGIPYHICPTVDRYDFVNVAEGNRVTGRWNVEARKRKITI